MNIYQWFTWRCHFKLEKEDSNNDMQQLLYCDVIMQWTGNEWYIAYLKNLGS